MGIVMVYDAVDVDRRVHCRLAWSKHALAGCDSTGSHTVPALSTAWLTQCTRSLHYTACTLLAVDTVPAFSTACRAHSSSRVQVCRWEWVDAGGLTGRDLIPLGPTGPAGTLQNAFDSHLCFASRPVHTPDGERLNYSGSNGKHSGSRPHRNASVGLAMLRTDGYAGMRSSGTVTTVALPCTGSMLLLTADMLGAGGSVVVNGSKEGVANVTGAAVGGLDLTAHVGRSVVLRLELHTAMVYTVGFADSATRSPQNHVASRMW
jgi:hypothetical protein